MKEEITTYNLAQTPDDRSICDQLALIIDNELPEAESKIWHSHPVWFLEVNPIVGYSRQKLGIRLMFWSGACFDEEQLRVKGGKFRDVSIIFKQVSEIKPDDLKRWLDKSRSIQ